MRSVLFPSAGLNRASGCRGLLACGFALSLPNPWLAAQSLGNGITQAWTPAGYQWTQADSSSHELVEVHGDLGRTYECRSVIPFRPRYVALWGSQRYVLEWGPRFKDANLYLQNPEGEWELVGVIPQELAVVRVFPLPEDRFLLQSPLLFTGEGRFGPYALGRLHEDGVIRMERILDASPDGTSWRRAEGAAASNSKASPARPPLDFLALSLLQAATPCSFIPVRGGGVLLYPSVGRILLLDGDGHVRRRVSVHPELEKLPLRTVAEKAPILLGAAPLPSGAVLLAVRSLEFLRKGAPRFRFPTRSEDYAGFLAALKTGFAPQGASERGPSEVGEMGKMLLAPFFHPQPEDREQVEGVTNIVWMSLDPATGRLHTLERPPYGAPVRLEPGVDPLAFHFITEGEDSVRMVP